MSFPRYERYEDSGVEWLGEVPEHWDIVPLYGLGKEREESNIGLISNNLLSLSYGRIIKKDIETSDGLLPESFETYQIVHPGDIIFRLTDLQNDKRSLRTAIATELGIITFAYAAFEPRVIMPAYLNYLLRDYDLRKIFYSMGGGVRQSMKFDDIKRLPTLVPPESEQSNIVKFLDYETAKIDALIEEQQRLIELLKEKRHAVISHAVTKGFSRDVEMTNSGYAELGNVPKHWKITPLGYFSRLHRGHDLTSDQQEEGPYPVVTSGGITGFHSAYIAKSPGVVTGRYGSTGRLFYIEENYWPHNTSLYVSDFFSNDPRFVWYSLQAINFESHSAKSAVPGIDRNDLHVLPIAVPPREEQTAIVRHLDTLMREFDSLSAEALRATELLQERRSALISAAVTGKIDVRAYMAKPVMSATQYSSGFAHQLLAAEILDRCNNQRMGRIKLQKLIHLCEYHGQIREVQGDYSRKAAGPFDARAMAGISKNLKKQKWFEEVKEGERYLYRPLEKQGEHKKYLAHWQAEMPRINEVLSLLGTFKTRECEIISTLYAAWNDLLIDGGPTDDVAILHEASSAERWHKSKEQIAPERWTKALQWMREKGLVPVGYGKHTRHTAGQIETTTEEAHEPA